MLRKWMTGAILLIFFLLIWFWPKEKKPKPANRSMAAFLIPVKNQLWSAPDSNSIPGDASGELIRYGKTLIRNTARYFGPQGKLGHYTNGMNCQNCHLDAGTRTWAGNFGAVAAIYPRFSERKGSVETISDRIKDCFERSLNGRAPDSNSLEMKAMIAYISWVGKDVQKGRKPAGAGLEQLNYLDRPADPKKGERVYILKCGNCHGTIGNGQPNSFSGYLYPPLWGEHSYNTAAGLYRLSKFAGFVKVNMPFGSDYKNEQLSNEEAWDLAAFVDSRPRPFRKFKKDWPDIYLKPVDLPEGPFPDSYSLVQHKYGPFAPIARHKKEIAVK